MIRKRSANEKRGDSLWGTAAPLEIGGARCYESRELTLGSPGYFSAIEAAIPSNSTSWAAVRSAPSTSASVRFTNAFLVQMR